MKWKSAPSCPQLLPLLADAAELLAYARTLPGLSASVLVPNFKGAQRAVEGGADRPLQSAGAT